MKKNMTSTTQRHLLYKQSSVAPLSDYMKNHVFQELIFEDGYFNVKCDERIYLNLRASSGHLKEAKKFERNDSNISLHIVLKEAATNNLRLRVWAYSLSEYLYILSKNGLTLRHRTYPINQADDDLLE